MGERWECYGYLGIWAIVKLEKVEGKGPAGAVYVSVDVCVL